jgi:hypothetical protein
LHFHGRMTHHTDEHNAGADRPLGRRLERVLDTVEALGGSDEHRREQLVETAEDRGLDRPLGEQAYDLAREEKLDPAFALALVLEGVSVRPLPGPRPDVETAEPNEPEWVDAPPEPAEARLELRLRQTFRRFRSHLDARGEPRGALDAMGQDPDLEPYDY